MNDTVAHAELATNLYQATYAALAGFVRGIGPSMDDAAVLRVLLGAAASVVAARFGEPTAALYLRELADALDAGHNPLEMH